MKKRSEMIRDMQWEQVRDSVNEMMKVLWVYLDTDGPMTSSELSAASGIPLLTVRPRLSDLQECGLVESTGERRGREGVWRAVAWTAARESFEAEQRGPEQLLLKGVAG